MQLDSHQHFWRYDPTEYPWIEPHWPIRRDFLPPDLEPHLDAARLAASIAVQARQTAEESPWLLALADAHPRIAGVVGWVDLHSLNVAAQLSRLAAHPKFVGVRHVVQDEPDDRFVLRPEFMNGLRELRKFKLTYDLLIFPRQLPAAIELVERFPDQPFVLDHIAKPEIRHHFLSAWRGDIQRLAKAPNVFCKVSGLITEAKWDAWHPHDFKPYLDTVFEAFGNQRVMFGSDWPVCLLAGSYAQVCDLVREYSQSFSAADSEAFWGGTAARFYGIKDGRHTPADHQ